MHCIQKAENSLKSEENWKKERKQEEMKSFFLEMMKEGDWNTPERLLVFERLWGGGELYGYDTEE